MMNEARATRIRREVSIAERVDGQVIATDSPVPCDCCGKLCVVRYYEMANGARLGRECALTIDIMAQHTQYAPQNFTREFAIFNRANKKQLAYLGL